MISHQKRTFAMHATGGKELQVVQKERAAERRDVGQVNLSLNPGIVMRI